MTAATPLPIKTAAELADADLEARAASRRAAREALVMRTVLWLFADSGGPVRVDAVLSALPETRPAVLRRALGDLNDDDLLVLRDDAIELAYPFSAAPTRFVARRADGRERFICCAIDALGLAPMLGEPVQIRSACHHCDVPLGFAVGPDGPGPGARTSWCGSRGPGPTAGARARCSEPSSTSSGRKSICARGGRATTTRRGRA